MSAAVMSAASVHAAQTASPAHGWIASDWSLVVASMFSPAVIGAICSMLARGAADDPREQLRQEQQAEDGTDRHCGVAQNGGAMRLAGAGEIPAA